MTIEEILEKQVKLAAEHARLIFLQTKHVHFMFLKGEQQASLAAHMDEFTQYGPEDIETMREEEFAAYRDLEKVAEQIKASIEASDEQIKQTFAQSVKVMAVIDAWSVHG